MLGPVPFAFLALDFQQQRDAVAQAHDEIREIGMSNAERLGGSPLSASGSIAAVNRSTIRRM